MKILTISDKIIDIIYTPSIEERLADIDFIISSGDLPNSYLEFIVTMLNKPLFYVFGNHHRKTVHAEHGKRTGGPEGCINIDNRIIEYRGLLIGGLEGSMRYRPGEHQYSDFEMCMKINRMKPMLYRNRILKKKYIDILVTHAPPLGIHDGEDLCHRGFECFNRFIKNYKPKYHIHGHIHYYGPDCQWLTEVGDTKVINTYGFQILEI
ncbi:MAG: metallophosphoesterase [Actinomycetia bacterium]|nr:metallophosphoesterase [Actinomycetes bacterium]